MNEMSGKRLNNTIFIMFMATEGYKKAHNLSTDDFLKFDDENGILSYISDCPDIFDAMREEEMVEEIDRYVSSS